MPLDPAVSGSPQASRGSSGNASGTLSPPPKVTALRGRGRVRRAGRRDVRASSPTALSTSAPSRRRSARASRRRTARWRSGAASVWAVGAVAIEVERLDPDPRGNELELTWNGSELAAHDRRAARRPVTGSGARADCGARVRRRVRRPRPPRCAAISGSCPSFSSSARLSAPSPIRRGDGLAKRRRDLGRVALESPDLAVEDRDERQRARGHDGRRPSAAGHHGDLAEVVARVRAC